jgi:3',5'-cyclic AMP phosphodiesterase CpdA
MNAAMRTLVHLSDLHFGSIRDAAVKPLIETVTEIRPNLIAVSGDLTQRAQKKQFRAARAFLDALPAPKIVVPGNHDVPLYNLLARFRGLEKYQRYIEDDLEPFYCDGEIAVLGINTARSLTFKSGRISEEQVGRAKTRLLSLSDAVTKIIVTHHPFDLPESYRQRRLVGRARMAIQQLNERRVDLFLAGHFHVGGAAPTAFQIPLNGYSSVVVQAGTAISTRTRGEHNTFNVLRIDLPRLSIERVEWTPERAAFAVSEIEHFRRGATGWSRLSS